MTYSSELLAFAESLLAQCRDKGVMVATAESCTGGLIAGLLTEIAGSSDVVDRGFVTYSNEAKVAMLGVHEEVIKTYGAVSEAVAKEMAQGALEHSRAQLSVAVTGVAGPGGGSAEKPVGTVHLAVAREGRGTQHVKCVFDGSRADVRMQTVEKAIEAMMDAIQ